MVEYDRQMQYCVTNSDVLRARNRNENGKSDDTSLESLRVENPCSPCSGSNSIQGIEHFKTLMEDIHMNFN